MHVCSISGVPARYRISRNLLNGGKYQLAFAMQPVRVETVLSIADANGVMPPKSTWFEPKLSERAGRAFIRIKKPTLILYRFLQRLCMV